MNDTKNNSLNFKVKETSQGYLAQGIEIPEIIIETSKEKLNDDLFNATNGYFKAFPEEKTKFIYS